MAAAGDEDTAPEGIFSLLDTDLYKLTMQNAVFKYFRNVDVTYKFTNRTSDLFLNRQAFEWLRTQISKLSNLCLSEEEHKYLADTCKFFTSEYLDYLKTFRFKPDQQVHLSFEPKEQGSQEGQIDLTVAGTWLETILYEIPLLALVSESYFKFCDKDWDYEGQEEKARDKGLRLMRAGCNFSDFGTRRRRDYKTHELIVKGLQAASAITKNDEKCGKLNGTSNVHIAQKYGLAPIGTVAHEWFMGIAAITNDYKNANELGLKYWTGTFGRGTLSIALTDTFGTPSFLEAFKKPAALDHSTEVPADAPTYAQIFTGTRQDSGDPAEFVKLIKRFYTEQGVHDAKVVVFSDSLDVDKCIEYKRVTEEAHLTPSFGIGTFFTNDFVHKSTGGKSVPLNIVIKVSSAGGRPAVKISDNLGKNTGDSDEVARVKRELGYTEKAWEGGDETTRWGVQG